MNHQEGPKPPFSAGSSTANTPISRLSTTPSACHAPLARNAEGM